VANGALITTDGRVEVVDFGGLEDYQRAVGGYITAVYSDHEDAIAGYANDEGLLIGLEPNLIASLIFNQPLVGNVVVLGRDE